MYILYIRAKVTIDTYILNLYDYYNIIYQIIHMACTLHILLRDNRPVIIEY